LTGRNRLAGAGGGLVASIATCPLDVIKTKLQAQRAIPGHPAYEGVVGECSMTNASKLRDFSVLVLTMCIRYSQIDIQTQWHSWVVPWTWSYNVGLSADLGHLLRCL